MVLVGGKKVAQEGKLLVEIPEFPAATLQDWRPERLPKLPVKAVDFDIKVDAQNQSSGTDKQMVEIPCIRMINKTITKANTVVLPVHNGLVDISPQPGLLKISLWSAPKGGWLTGLLAGFGAVVGGIAGSMAHELHSPMVVGRSEEDMALAANRMLQIGGGVVIVNHGKVIGEVALTVGGLLSNAGVGEVARGWNELNHYLQEQGCPWDDPLFGLGFLSFTGLPYVRITPTGIVDIRNKAIIFP